MADMRARMTHAEYVTWTRFYARKTQREELERMKVG